MGKLFFKQLPSNYRLATTSRKNVHEPISQGLHRVHRIVSLVPIYESVVLLSVSVNVNTKTLTLRYSRISMARTPLEP